MESPFPPRSFSSNLAAGYVAHCVHLRIAIFTAVAVDRRSDGLSHGAFSAPFRRFDIFLLVAYREVLSVLVTNHRRTHESDFQRAPTFLYSTSPTTPTKKSMGWLVGLQAKYVYLKASGQWSFERFFSGARRSGQRWANKLLALGRKFFSNKAFEICKQRDGLVGGWRGWRGAWLLDAL